ncbi:putative glutathione S-transferase [Rhodothalassium salexigens DSM 2132]|uniref:Putative glutathione S-transferase n=1 Tax=Rhodothalassium salexigens DSM 2132 TaxID=1188247 RepID=A0A4R2P8X2_RHOSA|nr:glutathione S-transferase family protein [Rhodothalassium salexigens]MBB4212517.1 putative glutathione S-transferase [Rhodothalassium salexigens DSM 2132]MBK1638486.1 glutathione-dependent reductase [Rhodothalassium salexigens DSM 2132]TCP31443.1 putative glutathione S-transferase [Rhodothalassium salexigens DSM 2132]
MGLLIDGVWHEDNSDLIAPDGSFRRPASRFDGRVGGDAQPPAAGRYHLYVAYSCPWAHRALVMRALKGLQAAIPVSVVHWHLDNHGWRFEPTDDGATVDAVHGFDRLHQVYTAAMPDYTGRVTVPVLWDNEAGTIVSNESADVMRMLNNDFNAVAERPDLDFYPADLAAEIDAMNERLHGDVNSGVYKVGQAKTQDAYDAAFERLFAALDALDALLASRRYLLGDRITESDWRLFTTLVRFDAVYVGHFKCNLRRIADYANLAGYLRELYQWPGVAETVVMTHIKRFYYVSQTGINPTGIVPGGPVLDFTAPHDRDHLKAA